MELKGMPDAVVYILTEKELDDLINLFSSNGWVWMGAIGVKAYTDYVEHQCGYPIRVTIENNYGTYLGSDKRELTLAEFKRSQNIMKYSVGDVLVSGNDQRKILGVHEYLYHVSEIDEFDKTGRDFTELELDNYHYTLKTDTPTKTDMTVAEIAKKLGMKPEELNVVADK